MRSCANSVSLLLREIGRNRRGIAVAHKLCTTAENSFSKQDHPQRRTSSSKVRKSLLRSSKTSINTTTSHEAKNPVNIAEEKRNIIRNTIRTSYMFKVPDTLLQSYDDAVYVILLLSLYLLYYLDAIIYLWKCPTSRWLCGRWALPNLRRLMRRNSLLSMMIWNSRIHLALMHVYMHWYAAEYIRTLHVQLWSVHCSNVVLIYFVHRWWMTTCSDSNGQTLCIGMPFLLSRRVSYATRWRHITRPIMLCERSVAGGHCPSTCTMTSPNIYGKKPM